jgi:aryl-alcohol dehydrogenase-like predicted oxidoreductase
MTNLKTVGRATARDESVRYREHRGLRLSEIGVGCYAMGGAYGPKDPSAFRRMLHHAVERGVRFFDTAEAYGEGERILGEALRTCREKVTIATKVGIRSGTKPNLSAAYIREASERSLIQLGTETIDLYQVHFDDPETPVQETVQALEDLVTAGKIRFYGVGHLPRERVEAYVRLGRPCSIMMELSAVAPHARESVLPICRVHDVGGIAFSVTGRGILTGTIDAAHRFGPDDIRSVDPLFQRERFASALRIAGLLRSIAERIPVQVAIAWVLAQQGVLCALIGPSTIQHLEENLGGSGWNLPAEELRAIEDFLGREEKRLAREQQASIEEILSTGITNPSTAFADLIYVMESGILQGLVSEAAVLPIFGEIFEARERLTDEAIPRLEKLRDRLRALIPESK